MVHAAVSHDIDRVVDRTTRPPPENSSEGNCEWYMSFVDFEIHVALST